MPAFLQSDPTATDQTIEARQQLLPRLTLKRMFLLLTGAIFLTWLIRLMIGSEMALYCALAVLLMVVGCLVLYAVVFLIAFTAARVVAMILGRRRSSHPAGGLLLDGERWQ